MRFREPRPGIRFARKRFRTNNLLRRCLRAAACEPLSQRLALSSVSGMTPRSLRQAPRSQARATSREPRDPGLPFGLRRNFVCRAALSGATKNPPERLAREGPCCGLLILHQARSLPRSLIYARRALSTGRRPFVRSTRCLCLRWVTGFKLNLFMLSWQACLFARPRDIRLN
jgi:hypothetical protein